MSFNFAYFSKQYLNYKQNNLHHINSSAFVHFSTIIGLNFPFSHTSYTIFTSGIFKCNILKTCTQILTWHKRIKAFFPERIDRIHRVFIRRDVSFYIRSSGQTNIQLYTWDMRIEVSQRSISLQEIVRFYYAPNIYILYEESYRECRVLFAHSSGVILVNQTNPTFLPTVKIPSVIYERLIFFICWKKV